MTPPSSSSSASRPNRRAFLGTAALAGLARTTTVHAAEPEPVRLGIIGAGGMGMNHVRLLAFNRAVRIEAVCDVDSQRQEAAAKTVEVGGSPRPKTHADLRKVLDDPAIEAVVIATPDHWHAPATILACAAGKHVYVEKPCSHNLREGRLMIEAARKHKRVVQVGTQSRSTPHVMQAMEKLRSGIIGDILVAKAWNSQRRGNIGHVKPSDPPAELDFDLWLGPAPEVPYRSNIVHANWRWWHAFGTGDMGNDGVHDIDIARWGLGVETLPTRVAALGGKSFFDDDQQFPDTQYVAFEYPDAGPDGRAKQLIFEQRIWSPYVQEGFENGDAFYGTEGMMVLGKSGGYRIYGRKNKLIEAHDQGSPDLGAHHADFLARLRDGGTPRADIAVNHLSTALCHLGNVATRVGRMLRVDPKAETIVGDSEASELLHRTYRPDHWAAPRHA